MMFCSSVAFFHLLTFFFSFSLPVSVSLCLSLSVCLCARAQFCSCAPCTGKQGHSTGPTEPESRLQKSSGVKEDLLQTASSSVSSSWTSEDNHGGTPTNEDSLAASPRGNLTCRAPPPVLSQTSLTVFLRVCQIRYKFFARKPLGRTRGTSLDVKVPSFTPTEDAGARWKTT